MLFRVRLRASAAKQHLWIIIISLITMLISRSEGCMLNLTENLTNRESTCSMEDKCVFQENIH